MHPKCTTCNSTLSFKWDVVKGKLTGRLYSCVDCESLEVHSPNGDVRVIDKGSGPESDLRRFGISAETEMAVIASFHDGARPAGKNIASS